MRLFVGLGGLIVLLLGVYLYFIIGRLLGMCLPQTPKWLRRIVSGVLAAAMALPAWNLFGLWAMILLHFAAVSALVQLVRWIMGRAGRRWTGKWDAVYRSSLLALAVTAAILGYAYVNMHHVVVTEYTVFTEKPIRPEGYDILFLSDLHFGTTMDEADLLEYCRDMAAAQPDVVILGGDIVDESATLEQVRAAFAALGRIPSAYGAYYVYGNHDKGRYFANCDFTPTELAQAVQSAGVHILEDETVSLGDELTISGRRDRSDANMDQRPRTPAESLLQSVPGNSFHILADHQPREMAQNAAAGFDLMLSGHTHAGQIWPVGLITTLFDRGTVNYGRESFGRMELVVSSGMAGWGYPFRTGKHSEYVLVHVKTSA